MSHPLSCRAYSVLGDLLIVYCDVDWFVASLECIILMIVCLVLIFSALVYRIWPLCIQTAAS